MKSLQDALYNWLTIQVVADARPEDHAAQDTAQLFKNILKIDFQIEKVAFVKEEEMYIVSYQKGGKEQATRFPVEFIEGMLEQIQSEPEKYTNYPKDI
ncbi:hypothetical protein PNH38_03645 [Anoxybacillus rupiensis]|uniref:Uncharacterized protein n=1 Tax=Anoxybacteroides rupiense TaxID=311460 RepID=A0ABT5W358_9BACL|nr:MULTISPECIES: hypothetical protein [Anoxybacillus]KXG10409.1 hypothetical protein AT864_01000 [Anoxybacillus sp. P3H1B]MBB3906307.1 hypothetical protein [Anoxybacillus rupiensis]MBS2770709.1 hypothetical protein [Anoxybacillus rupiensis]MDE8562975.1 hypothetical protein [Anoxybacillus rupiensis]QHC03550.1 hypothetical protein GRQ40_05980 [Anoxybacillus sp. PDR2]